MLHIFTLYYGSKFTKDNVNNLYKQIKKYYKSEFTFYCYTDKKDKLVSGIKKIKLERESRPSVRGAWYKIDFFHSFNLFFSVSLIPIKFRYF